MNILVTGGSGFVGTYLSRKLLEEGHSVRILDKLVPSDDVYSRVTWCKVDDISTLNVNSASIFRNVDAVYHLAAKLPIERLTLEEYRKVNVVGTRNILELAKLSNVSKVVHVSSSAVYGVPSCPVTEHSPRHPVENYGISKYEAELVCEKYRSKYNMNISMVRPRAIIGKERLGAFHLLFLTLKNNKPLYCIGTGRNLVQLISVTDLVDMLVKLLEKDCLNEDFNVGTDRFSSLNDDMRNLAKLIGSRSRMLYIPSFLGKNLCKIINNFLPIAEWHYELVDKDFYFDISKAKNTLNWKPSQSNVEMLYEAYKSYLENASREGSSVHKSPVKSKLLKALVGK